MKAVPHAASVAVYFLLVLPSAFCFLPSRFLPPLSRMLAGAILARPLALRLASTFLPLVVCIRLRKPETRFVHLRGRQWQGERRRA